MKNDADSKKYVDQYVTNYLGVIKSERLVNISKADLVCLYDQLKEDYIKELQELCKYDFYVKKVFLSYLKQLSEV